MGSSDRGRVPTLRATASGDQCLTAPSAGSCRLACCLDIDAARNLSQRELAARAGLTNGAISQIAKNRSSPSVASLKSLLDATEGLDLFCSIIEIAALVSPARPARSRWDMPRPSRIALSLPPISMSGHPFLVKNI